MSRWKASAIHCGISLVVMLAIATLMASTWYPPLLAWAGGQVGILAILFFVDISVGPFLTLMVFKEGKPSLKSDLCVIALLQVLGLAYGLYTLFEARPIYIVFSVDSFHLVKAVDIPLENLGKAKRDEFKSPPLNGPQVVAVHLPENAKDKMDITLKVLSGGADIHQYPEYYLPYAEVTQEVLKKAAPLQKMADRDGPARAKLAAWLEKNRRDAAGVKYLPLYAKAHDLTVLIDGGTAEVLDILDIGPS